MNRRSTGLVVAAVLAGVLALTLVSAAFAFGPFGPSNPGPNPVSTVGGWTPGADGPGPGGPRGGRGNGFGPGPGYGPGYGSGMMGGGYGYGPGGMMQGWATGNPNQPTISISQAQQAVQAYLDRLGNRDLAIDEVMEFQYNDYAIVKEKSTGIGAFEVLINKWSGTVVPEPGPNMLWNTKYGMMGQNSWMAQRMGYPVQTGPLTVTAEQAKQIAQRWLDQNQPGSTTETPDRFYGYYTVHVLKAGKITGMLSVNGYTGQVWYHTWHGAFIQMTTPAAGARSA